MVLLVRGSHWQGKKDLEGRVLAGRGTVIQMNLVVLAQLCLSFLNTLAEFWIVVPQGKAFEVLGSNFIKEAINC